MNALIPTTQSTRFDSPSLFPTSFKQRSAPEAEIYSPHNPTVSYDNTANGRVISFSTSLSPQDGWESRVGENSSIREAKLAEVRKRIENFTRKEKGWAGEGSVPVDKSTAEFAYKILKNLPKDIPAPQPTMSGDGEIGLTWYKHADYLDASIDADGYLVWSLKTGNDFLGGDVLNLGDGADFTNLFDALASFYQ